MEAVRWKNMIPIILLVGLLAITYILLYYKIDAKVVFALKVVTSLGFILLGLYALKHSDGKYPALVISGLVAGFTGDVVLGLRRIDAKRKTKYFIAGIALFFYGTLLLRGSLSAFVVAQDLHGCSWDGGDLRRIYYSNEPQRRQMR